ncbi:MAG: type VI secretion system tip protein TssI/VgrG [Gemmobacter sp.]|nr:type VI secretion system tip protein TssI/VgrG [Gemmobacter sp.]
MPTKSDADKTPSLGGELADLGLQLRCAIVEEALSTLTLTRIEVLHRDRALPLAKLVGRSADILLPHDSGIRKFLGVCVSAEYLGIYRGHGRYLLEVRPRLWFLTRARDCRVYQDKTTPDVVQDILGTYGFSAHLEKRLSQTFEARDYCLQYRETDFAFLSRLMEEEGIYYFFDHVGDTEKLVLADAVSAHKTVAGKAVIEFVEGLNVAGSEKDHIYDIAAIEQVTTGKVSLDDYNFETPGQDLISARAMERGTHNFAKYEAYDYPGHYRKSALGETRARVQMEAEALRYQTWRAAGNMRWLGTGNTFGVTGHPHTQDETQFMVTAATHYIQTDPQEADPGDGKGLRMPDGDHEAYHCMFRFIPAKTQYRAELSTPWPEIAGVQTAVVVGPKGEEIHTDKYGRVRIQFHWGRLGKLNEKSSVFVRTMMPWTGKSWGMVAIPRIGQEVVVQFEEGNPDRPIIVGMLYNADNMPPWKLPDNMTQSGVKTNSSKGGGGYNELMLEDKKGAELVRFQAEKDYVQTVKNDATITVGLEKKDKGDMSLTVHRHLTETLKTGDHTFMVEDGNQTIGIKKNKTEKIEGNAALTVTGNVTETVEKGNVSHTVAKGNEDLLLKMGDFSLETKLGSVKITAMKDITLTVGKNSIVINQMGVTVTGMMVTVEAKAMLEAKSPMTQVKGDGMLILKGGLTMIN